jgi:tetratricopeptide (TPR) repeat protein
MDSPGMQFRRMGLPHAPEPPFPFFDMNLPDPKVSARSARKTGWNALLLVTGAGVVWAVLAAQPEAAKQIPVIASAASGPSAPEPGWSLLDRIPDSAGHPFLTDALAAVRARPQQAPGWIKLGDALAQLQRETGETGWFELAGKAYEEALRRQPGLAGAMAGMAWVYGGQHQFEVSLLWAGKALETDPGHATSHGIAGDAWVELGEYGKAFDSYQKMMDLRPDLSSWSRGAHLLWLTGQQSRAVLLMTKAVNSGGPYAENTEWCRARLALMLFHDGALLAAEQVLEPALAQAKPNRFVLLAAGRIAAARSQWEAAATHYGAVLESGPHHEALAALGDLAALQERPEEAREWYGKVEALHRTHRQKGVHDHLEMARYLADHDLRPEEALRLALEHGEPRNVLEWDTLAWVWLKQGDAMKAAGYIKKALDTGTRDAEMFYHAGRIALAAGDSATGRKYLQKALNLNPAFNLLHARVARRLLDSTQPAPMSVSPPVPVHEPQPRPLTRLR